MRLSNTFSRSAAVGSLLLATLAGCSTTGPSDESSSSAVRSITNAEALDDFNEIAASFRSLYGAMERKQARYHFNYEQLVVEYRARVTAATTESEYRGIFQEFISRFEDPHVSLSFPITSDDSRGFSLPFKVMPVEDTFVVYDVDTSLGGALKRGDELVSIDGKAAMDLANSWEKYGSLANHRASMHTAAARLTGRAAYLFSTVNPSSPVTVHVRGADGLERDVVLDWKETVHPLPPTTNVPRAGETTRQNAMAISDTALEVITAESGKMGARVPYFMTPEVRAALRGAREVTPSDATFRKFSLDHAAATAINYFALKYEFQGKKVLFIRLPSYSPPDAAGSLNYLRALIDEFQPQVDALVLDETHNPGGSVGFAAGVISLLANGQYNDYVQQMHADRKWINALLKEGQQLQSTEPEEAAVVLDWAHQVDVAYSAGRSLSAPFPFTSLDGKGTPDATHWSKPAMILVDELSVSCADLVPAVAKANGMATLFGQTTMGGGGNVETALVLSHTQAELKLSRGLGTVFDPTGAYPEERQIEDNGVSPDISHTHTLQDFRAGYVGYAAAFNAALVSKITPANTQTP